MSKNCLIYLIDIITIYLFWNSYISCYKESIHRPIFGFIYSILCRNAAFLANFHMLKECRHFHIRAVECSLSELISLKRLQNQSF